MDPKRPSSSNSKRALRLLLWLAGIFLVLILAGLFLFDRLLRSKYEPALAELQKNVTENVDFFCEQQALLAADPWFHEPRTEGDAGPLLNAWSEWEDGKGSTGMPKGSPLAIPAQLPQRPGDFKDWLTSKVDVSTLDFSWMEKLHGYDRWDLLKSAPVPPRMPFNMATAPIPKLLPLQLWAKFRLLHGLRTGQPLQAARDVRQLAWLAYRTDTMLGGVIATLLLKAEREAYQSMQAPPPEWHPMSTEQVERMRALVMSGVGFSNVAAPVEVAKKARSCGEPAVTRCISLAEGAFMMKYMQPLARETYSEAYAAFEKDLAAPPCATSLARTIWEQGITMGEEGPENSVPGQPEALKRLPHWYLGRHIAGIVIAISNPDFQKLQAFRKALAAGDFKAEH